MPCVISPSNTVSSARLFSDVDILQRQLVGLIIKKKLKYSLSAQSDMLWLLLVLVIFLTTDSHNKYCISSSRCITVMMNVDFTKTAVFLRTESPQSHPGTCPDPCSDSVRSSGEVVILILDPQPSDIAD